MRPKWVWVWVAVAALLLLLVAAVSRRLWMATGAAEISVGGWLALVFGVIMTLGLGIGLMALVFISSRRGYDERGPDGH